MAARWRCGAAGHGRARRWRQPSGGWLAALFAFAGAVLGGLILNVMPCVFPILSLKALSLAKAGGDERGARHEALAYTGGAIAVCLALGGDDPGVARGRQRGRLGVPVAGSARRRAAVAADGRDRAQLGGAVRTAGAAVRQQRRRRERRVRDRRAGGVRRDAVHRAVHGRGAGRGAGAAMAGGARGVRAGWGWGWRCRSCCSGSCPRCGKRLPKPGAWMDTLRRILSIPMWLTAVALAWVLGRQAGVDGMGLALLVALGFAHRAVGGGAAAGARAGGSASPAVACCCAIAVAGVVADRAPVPPGRRVARASRSAKRSSPRCAQQGRPVFAYFTADWCLTCKVNERVAIDTDAVQASFKREERRGAGRRLDQWRPGARPLHRGA